MAAKYKARLKASADYKVTQRQERKADHLCPDCGSKPTQGKTYCDVCISYKTSRSEKTKAVLPDVKKKIAVQPGSSRQIKLATLQRCLKMFDQQRPAMFRAWLESEIERSVMREVAA